MSGSPRSDPDWVDSLATRARTADGVPPFSDQALVDYRLGKRELVAIDQAAAALVAGSGAEFVVDPESRDRGLGTRMLEQLLAEGVRLFWAHGDHPAKQERHPQPPRSSQPPPMAGEHLDEDIPF